MDLNLKYDEKYYLEDDINRLTNMWWGQQGYNESIGRNLKPICVCYDTYDRYAKYCVDIECDDVYEVKMLCEDCFNLLKREIKNPNSAVKTKIISFEEV